MTGDPRLDGPPDGSPHVDPTQGPQAHQHSQQPYPPQPYPQQPYPPQPYPQQPYPPQVYSQPSIQPGWPPAYPIAPALPKPGSMPIGPNDFGSTFGSTFGTFRRIWKPILVAVTPAIALTAILIVTLGTVVARLGPTILDRMNGIGSVGDFVAAVPHFEALVIAGSLGYALIGIYSIAVVVGTARAAGRAIAGDRVPTLHIVGSAVRALPRVLTWVAICAVLVVVVAGLGLLAFIASSERAQRITYLSILAIVVMLVGSAFNAVFVLKLPFLIPAMMLEPGSANPITGVVTPGPARPLGLIHAARRSWKLTTGRVWRTFGISMLISLLAGLGQAVLSQILNIASSVLTVVIREIAVYVIAYTLYFALLAGLYLVAAMIQVIGQTVLYIDARIRDEGIAPAILDHAVTGSPADPWVRWHERY